ncbi:MAG: YHS domain-containing (seleno)protein [Phormidesmis sp.]
MSTFSVLRFNRNSAEHREVFARNPEQYAPQYGGFCAWAVAERYTAPVDPNAWEIVDGKLYLNYDARIQRRYSTGVTLSSQRDIPGNIARRVSNCCVVNAPITIVFRASFRRQLRKKLARLDLSDMLITNLYTIVSGLGGRYNEATAQGFLDQSKSFFQEIASYLKLGPYTWVEIYTSELCSALLAERILCDGRATPSEYRLKIRLTSQRPHAGRHCGD